VGGENWETRLVRSQAGLLRSPRDLHLDLATFGALPSLRIFDALLALLGTALATLGRKFGVPGLFWRDTYTSTTMGATDRLEM
jgi:hypothetical protein